MDTTRMNAMRKESAVLAVAAMFVFAVFVFALIRDASGQSDTTGVPISREPAMSLRGSVGP